MEQKAEYKTKRQIVTAAFPEPLHTQTPNKFFEMIPDMGDAELRVTLVMIRNTFGWHRDGFKMGVSKIAAAAGLSRQGALDGAKEAETRGTFRRTNPDAQGEAEWELIVTLQQVDPSTQWRPPLNWVEAPPQPARGQSPVKESKETIKENDEVLAQISKAYESEIGVLTPMIADELREAATAYPLKWTLDAIREAATQNKRGWKYILAILSRWKAQGNQEAMNKPQGNKNYKPRDLIQERYGGIIEWAKEAQDNDNTTRNGSNHGKVGGSVPQLETR